MATAITLEFRVNEDVSPEFLAKRVTEACGAYFTLRHGERVIYRDPDKPLRVVIFTVNGTEVVITDNSAPKVEVDNGPR